MLSLTVECEINGRHHVFATDPALEQMQTVPVCSYYERQTAEWKNNNNNKRSVFKSLRRSSRMAWNLAISVSICVARRRGEKSWWSAENGTVHGKTRVFRKREKDPSRQTERGGAITPTSLSLGIRRYLFPAEGETVLQVMR